MSLVDGAEARPPAPGDRLVLRASEEARFAKLHQDAGRDRPRRPSRLGRSLSCWPARPRSYGSAGVRPLLPPTMVIFCTAGQLGRLTSYLTCWQLHIRPPWGVDARLVQVEVDVNHGIPPHIIVGLPDAAVRRKPRTGPFGDQKQRVRPAAQGGDRQPRPRRPQKGRQPPGPRHRPGAPRRGRKPAARPARRKALLRRARASTAA